MELRMKTLGGAEFIIEDIASQNDGVINLKITETVDNAYRIYQLRRKDLMTLLKIIKS